MNESKLAKLLETVKVLIESGKLPADYKDSDQYKQALFQASIDDGFLEVTDNGAGIKVRSIASFSDTPEGYEDALMDHFGEDKVGSYIKDGEKKYVYLNENGDWDHVDSSSFEWADLADGVGFLPEMIGGTAAGIAGFAGGGPAMAIPTAAGGTMAGRAVKKSIADLLGIDNEQAAVDSLADYGESAIYGGVGEGVGQAGAKVISKIANPFKHKYGLEQDRLEAMARDAGIQLTPADTMGVNSLTRLENLLGYGLTGDRIADFKNMQFKGLKDYLVKNIEKRTGGRNNLDLGESIQKKTQDTVQSVKDNFSKRYDELAQVAGTEKMPMWEAQRRAKKMLEEVDLLPDAYIDGGVKNKLKAIAELGKKEAPVQNGDAITPTVGQQLGGFRQNAPKPAEASIPELSYPEFKAVRSEIADMSKSNVAGGDATAGKFKYVKQGLDSDLEGSMQAAGMGGEKKAIDGDYAAFKQSISRPEIKNVIGTDKKIPVDPENVVKTMVTPRGTTRLQNAINVSGAKDDLAKGHINNMMDQATITTRNGDEYISAAKLGSYQKRYGDVHKQLVGDETQKVLDNYTALDRAVGASTPERINPSGTAKGIESIADGLLFLGLGPNAAVVPAAKYGAAKYYMSDMGKKHLTKGLLDDQQVKNLQKKLGSFGTTGAPVAAGGYE